MADLMIPQYYYYPIVSSPDPLREYRTKRGTCHCMYLQALTRKNGLVNHGYPPLHDYLLVSQARPTSAGLRN